MASLSPSLSALAFIASGRRFFISLMSESFGGLDNFSMFASSTPNHSTVTLFAKFLGLSTSVPRAIAV